ncbi:hypothetical protein WICPIJ_007918 [Wickerhamomyces pijperi]|uniref:Uncharacterized protein n=1 Tax=Wickerhamomyces pijperi TaxID=599730 RepID=A0A9P8PZB2_WICPI|nr:hypothetical protein WICPIJ_007918 [Wickerhamomyces pijperi]
MTQNRSKIPDQCHHSDTNQGSNRTNKKYHQELHAFNLPSTNTMTPTKTTLSRRNLRLLEEAQWYGNGDDLTGRSRSSRNNLNNNRSEGQAQFQVQEKARLSNLHQLKSHTPSSRAPTKIPTTQKPQSRQKTRKERRTTENGPRKPHVVRVDKNGVKRYSAYDSKSLKSTRVRSLNAINGLSQRSTSVRRQRREKSNEQQTDVTVKPERSTLEGLNLRDIPTVSPAVQEDHDAEAEADIEDEDSEEETSQDGEQYESDDSTTPNFDNKRSLENEGEQEEKDEDKDAEKDMEQPDAIFESTAESDIDVMASDDYAYEPSEIRKRVKRATESKRRRNTQKAKGNSNKEVTKGRGKRGKKQQNSKEDGITKEAISYDIAANNASEEIIEEYLVRLQKQYIEEWNQKKSNSEVNGTELRTIEPSRTLYLSQEPQEQYKDTDFISNSQDVPTSTQSHPHQVEDETSLFDNDVVPYYMNQTNGNQSTTQPADPVQLNILRQLSEIKEQLTLQKQSQIHQDSSEKELFSLDSISKYLTANPVSNTSTSLQEYKLWKLFKLLGSRFDNRDYSPAPEPQSRNNSESGNFGEVDRSNIIARSRRQHKSVQLLSKEEKEKQFYVDQGYDLELKQGRSTSIISELLLQVAGNDNDNELWD